MSENTSSPTFLEQATAVIEQNLSNEQFGVTELAAAMNMSRSSLLRKVKKESKLSVSQLINQVRLKQAMDLLRKSSLNVSEVGHRVGFSSTSYFIKCFREYYGYPPGEVGKRPEQEAVPVKPARSRKYWLIGTGVLLLVALSLNILWPRWQPAKERSIAVLPFKNESADSSNVYLINGLMESTLNNLQKIKDLRVISRTSTEKYRNSSKSIPEMGRELNVNYFVEGSGQKIGDQIVLHVQLIDAATDRHLWSKQYRRQAGDIFDLQQDVASSIAEEIRAIITPEEQQRINRRPTENLEAYDLYLKGRERSTSMSRTDRLAAIEFYKQAIALDPTFALAYAMMALDYYSLDLWLTTKEFTNEISLNADKAMFYEPTLGESLVAKAVDYINKKEYAEAEPYLEKALEYHPNSAEVLAFLTDFYAHYMLNTGKYLTYALRGIQLDIASQDSVGASYTYLRLANALIQTGFVDESLKYIDKSLKYNPDNPYSNYIKAFVLYAKDGDLRRTRSMLVEEFNKDTTRFDILQDIGKVSYYLRDYPGAYEYYKKFLAYRESAALDVYRHENMTIGHVFALVGKDAEAKALIRDYKDFLDQDKSIYQNLGYMAYSVYEGDHARAIEYLKKFAKEDNVQYWIILFMEDDPMIAPIKDNPEFKKYMGEAKARFWKNHETLKLKLQEEGLL